MFLNSRTSTVTNTVLNATAATKAAATAAVTEAAAAMEATANGEGAFHGECGGMVNIPWSPTHAMARRPRQIQHTAGENIAGGCKCRYLSFS